MSGMPDHFLLDDAATIVITIDQEGATYVPIEDVEIVLSHPAKGIIASGSFDENGTIIDDGDFIVSVASIIGTTDQRWGFDNTTGNVYFVSILLQSSDFQPSTGNELTVFVDRGVELSRLRTESVTFDITGPNTWFVVLVVVAAIELCIFLGLFYAVRKSRMVRNRKIVKKRKLREK